MLSFQVTYSSLWTKLVSRTVNSAKSVFRLGTIREALLQSCAKLWCCCHIDACLIKTLFPTALQEIFTKPLGASLRPESCLGNDTCVKIKGLFPSSSVEDKEVTPTYYQSRTCLKMAMRSKVGSTGWNPDCPFAHLTPPNAVSFPSICQLG